MSEGQQIEGTTPGAKPKPPRKRRWLRRIGWSVLGLLGLVLLLLGLLLVTLQTDFGREKVRSRLESELSEVFAGEVSVGKLEGNLLSDFSLHDISVSDAQGRPAISFKSLELGYDLFSLRDKKVAVSKLILSGLVVHAHRDVDGSINLAKLLAPDDEPPMDLSAWKALVPRVELRGATLSYTDAQLRVSLEELDLDAGFTLRDNRITASLASLTARVHRAGAAPGDPEIDLPLATHGNVTIAGDGIVVDSFAMHLGEAAIEVPSLRLGAMGEVAAQSTVLIPAALLRIFDPSLGLLADVSLALSAERGSEDAPIQFAGTGTLGSIPLQLAGQAQPQSETFALHLEASEIDASQVWQGQVSTRLNLVLDASATGLDLATMGAKLDLDIEGRVDKAAPQALRIEASLDAGIAEARVVPKAGPDWIDAHGRVRLSDLTILEGSLELKHAALHSLAAPYVDIAGDLRLSAKVSGPLDKLALEGSLESSRLRGFGNRARGLRATWKGAVVGGTNYAGEVTLTASALHAADKDLGSIRLSLQSDQVNHFQVELANRGAGGSHAIDLKSEVVLAPSSTQIDVQRVVLAYRGLSWRGQSGRIVLGPANRISVDGLALSSSAGDVKVDGAFVLHKGFSDGSLDLVASDVDLADLSRVLQLQTPAYGRASLRAQLSNRGGRRPRADVQLELREVGVGPDLPATSGTIALSIDRRELGLDVALEVDRLGSIILQAQGLGPHRPLAAEGWSQLDEGALRSLTFSANDLDLSALSGVAEELPSTGRLSVHANLGQSGTSGQIKVSVKDLLHSRLAAAVQGRLQIDIIDKQVTMSAEASVASRAQLEVSAEALLPGPWLRPSTLSKLSAKVLQGARLKVRELDVDWWQQMLSPGSEPYGLRAELDLEVDAGGRSGVLTLRAKQPKGGPYSKRGENRATLRAEVSERKLGVEFSASLARHEVLRGTASVARGWKAFLEGGADAMVAGEIGGEIEILKVSFATLQGLLAPSQEAARVPVRGQLAASGTLSGTMEQPRLSVLGHTEGAAFAGTEFSELRFSGEYAKRRVKAEVNGKQKLGGLLSLIASAELSPDPSFEAQVKATDWDIAFLKQFFPALSPGGLLSADIRASGHASKPLLVGSARLRKGKVQPGAPLYGIRNLNLDLKLGSTELAIEGQGVSGAGTLQFNGSLGLHELIPQALELDIVLKGLPVRAGPFAVRVASKTSVRGQAKGPDWKVNVDVGDTIVSLSEEGARTLHAAQLPDDIVFVDSTDSKRRAAAPSILVTPSRVIDVYIRAPESIAVRGDPVRTTVDIDLHARLARELSLEGTVAARGGWVELFGRRYEIRRGDVAFSGPTDPGLDIELRHEFSTMTLAVVVAGTGANPELSLRADPARFDDAELLAFVLGASPDDDPGREQSAAGKATGAASGLVAEQLQSIVKDVVPIDVLKIDLAEDEAAAEQLTVGKWLTSKIFFAYRRRFEVKDLQNSNEAVIEYRFKRRWLLESFYGDENTGGIDLLWNRRF